MGRLSVTVFSISLRTTVVGRKNPQQWLCNFLLGVGGGGGAVGSISAVSRVRSLILPEETFRGMSAVSFSRTAAGNRA